MTSSAASLRGPFVTAIAALFLLISYASPAVARGPDTPIDFDLRNWDVFGPDTSDWQVSDDGREVLQTVNGDPTFFVSPETVINQTIRGQFEVQTAGDDDIVGFVFGYTAPGEADPFNYDFVVLSWKGEDQNFGGRFSPAGFTLSRVDGQLSENPDERDGSSQFMLDTLWGHEEEADDPRVEVLESAWDPEGGWEPNTVYNFELTYTATSFRLVLNDELVLEADGAFPEGRFGFYNYSQRQARYGNFTQEPAPEPEPEPEPDEVDPDEPGTTRLPGGDVGDAVDVADQICTYLADDGQADQVALARNDDFADALAGSQLPFVDCILFTSGGPDAVLDTRTRDEVDRALAPGGVVYILGGTNAVSQDVEDELRSGGYDVRRLSGPTRFETAEVIALETIAVDGVQGTPRDVVVAYGLNWPDAITGGAWVNARAGALLVLSDTSSLHPAAARILSQVDPGRTVLVGGTGVVGDEIESAVPNPRRVAGVNRMATAIEVADGLWPEIPASGEDFVFVNLDRADAWTLALAAAPLSAALDAPQLGVRTDSLPAETEQYLIDSNISMIPSRVLLGDLSFINDDVAQSIEVITAGS